MPILPTGKRTHCDQDVQVVGPFVHDQPDAKWQLDLDTPQGHEFQAWVDMLTLTTKACKNKAFNPKRRWEFRQDFLVVPSCFACARVYGQYMAMQEGATHGHRRDDAWNARTACAVPPLDLHALCAYNPEISRLNHPHLCVAVEHEDMWVAPEHARALLATWWACVCGQASLRSALAHCSQMPCALQLRTMCKQAMVGQCASRSSVLRANN